MGTGETKAVVKASGKLNSFWCLVAYQYNSILKEKLKIYLAEHLLT
jgi:hypothetical protein